MDKASKSGGCQCGKVRYSVDIAGAEAYLCHCRMCQRATGGFAASFVHIKSGATWHVEPAWYASSPVAKRPFCRDCGSPLGFKFNNREGIDITFGSLDDPNGLKPVAHAGAESLHEAWLDTSKLPRQRSDQTESVVKEWRDAGLEVPE